MADMLGALKEVVGEFDKRGKELAERAGGWPMHPPKDTFGIEWARNEIARAEVSTDEP